MTWNRSRQQMRHVMHRILNIRTFSTVKTKNIYPFETVTNLSITDAVEALKYGPGFALYDNIIGEDELSRCNRAISNILKHENETIINDSTDIGHETGHDQIYGNEESQGTRIWNLLNKGTIFEQLVQLNIPMEIFDDILGNDFILGSFAANHLQPGASAQHPHLDYPYWDYNNKESWRNNISYNDNIMDIPRNNFMSMNCQMLIMCDDFTIDNGSTAVLPYSQRNIQWPDKDYFNENCVYVTGNKGSVMLFTGLLHHCSTENKSDKSRTSILGQYLSKYVAPMENIDKQVCNDVKLRASVRMKQLFGQHQIYPKMFEQPTEHSIEFEYV
eukprot:285135_1